MPTDEIRQLFREWLERTEGDAPSEGMLRALKDLPDADLEDLLQEAYARFEPRGPVLFEAQSAKLLAGIRQAIRLQEDPAESIPLPVRRPWWRYAAAAVLLLLATGAWFLFVRHVPAPLPLASQAQRFKNDVAPGGNKAVLTLGNGRQIILDSAHTGTLAQQGSARIIKTDSGELAYIIDERHTETVYNVLSTPRGGQYQLTLPDGSRVWLDAASSIRYPTAFTGKERRVEMSGQAYFEIAHRQTQPFIVSVNGTEARDIGTAFNINGYGDEPSIKVTLVEGSVEVRKNAHTLTLTPNQQAQVKQDHIELLKDANIPEVMAWKNGVFKFSDATIESILRQMARWYDVDVVYETRISQHFVADIPRDVPVSQMLGLLELTGQVHFKIEGRKITVIP